MSMDGCDDWADGKVRSRVNLWVISEVLGFCGPEISDGIVPDSHE